MRERLFGLRKQFLEQPIVPQLFKGLQGITVKKHFQTFFIQACGRDFFQRGCQSGYVCFGVRTDPETQLRRKPHCPQQPHRVFYKTPARIADQPDTAGLYIVHAVNVIYYRFVCDVIKQGIDGEITAPYIFIDGPVNVVAYNSAIDGVPSAIIIMVGRPESGNLHDLIAETDMGKPETTPNQPAVTEQFSYLLGRGVRHHVKILWFSPQQQIAHTTPDQVAGIAGIFQAVQYFQRAVTDIFRRDVVLCTRINGRLGTQVRDFVVDFVHGLLL